MSTHSSIATRALEKIDDCRDHEGSKPQVLIFRGKPACGKTRTRESFLDLIGMYYNATIVSEHFKFSSVRTIYKRNPDPLTIVETYEYDPTKVGNDGDGGSLDFPVDVNVIVVDIEALMSDYMDADGKLPGNSEGPQRVAAHVKSLLLSSDSLSAFWRNWLVAPNRQVPRLENDCDDVLVESLDKTSRYSFVWVKLQPITGGVVIEV